MKILAFLLLFVSAIPVFGREYSNVVKVENRNEIASHLTGLVIKETEEFYFVLTCWHVMEYKVSGVPLGVDFMSMDGKVRTRSISEIVRSDADKDLLLLKVQKLPEVEVKPAKLAKEVTYDGMGKVYGFSSQYVINNTYVLRESEQKSSTADGSKLLKTKGPCLQGVSGGPLVKDGAVIGIQTSTAGSTGCLYVHVETIREFLEW
jgi:hypothetical protein